MNLHHAFLFAGTICIPTSWSPYVQIRYWKMKSQFIIPDSFYLHAIFNLHHEILYAGVICIPTSMISIPACEILENQTSIYNAILFIFMLLYLMCMASFFVCWAWSLYLQVNCMQLTTMKPGIWKKQFIMSDFFLFACYTSIVSFHMSALSVYPRVWSLYLHVISWKWKLNL